MWTYTVITRPYGGVTRWEPGAWDARVGRWGWLGARAPWPEGRCVAVKDLADGSVELEFEEWTDEP